MKWRKFSEKMSKACSDFMVMELATPSWLAKIPHPAYRSVDGRVAVYHHPQNLIIDISQYKWLDEGKEPKAKGRKKK